MPRGRKWCSKADEPMDYMIMGAIALLDLIAAAAVLAWKREKKG